MYSHNYLAKMVMIMWSHSPLIKLWEQIGKRSKQINKQQPQKDLCFASKYFSNKIYQAMKLRSVLKGRYCEMDFPTVSWTGACRPGPEGGA